MSNRIQETVRTITQTSIFTITIWTLFKALNRLGQRTLPIHIQYLLIAMTLILYLIGMIVIIKKEELT